MNSRLVQIVTATDQAVRNQSLDAVCHGASIEELLAECAALDAFRRESNNLYERVRALLQAAQIPLFTFTIQLDQRTGLCTISGVDSTGHPLPFEVGHKLLDYGRQALTQLQMQAQAQQA